MNVDLEFINCNICGSRDYRKFDKVNSMYPKYLAGRFDLVKCRKCSLVYINPRPAMQVFLRLYASSDYIQQYSPYNLANMSFSVSNKRYLEVLDQLEAYLPNKGRILEIGMGWGIFLKVATDRSWKAFGIEASEQQVKFAREDLGIECAKGVFEDIQFKDDSFEAVFMDNVLEHTLDPMKICRKVNRILVKGGVFIIRVPNVDGFYSVVSRNYNKLYDSARKYKYKSERVRLQHLYEFSLKTLRLLAEKAGFEILKASTIQLDRYNDEADFGIRKLGKKIINSLGSSFPGLGDQCVVFARKK